MYLKFDIWCLLFTRVQKSTNIPTVSAISKAMFTDRHMFSSITDRNRLDVVNNVAIIMLGYVETMQRVQREGIVHLDGVQ